MDPLRSTSNVLQPSGPLSSESSPFDTKPEDPLVQLANEVEQHPFTTGKSLQRSMEYRRQALYEDRTRDQYLVFTSVPAAQACRLSDERSETSKYCRLFFNTKTGTLIAKVRPENVYELAIRSFDMLVFYALHAMNVHDDVVASGSVTVDVGNWTMEADSCFAPASGNLDLSFCMVIGLSESERKLALHARGWLETYSSSVKVVVTISLKREYPDIILYRWELVAPRGYGVLPRSSRLLARPTAFVQISRTDDTTSVTGASYTNGRTTTTTQLDLPFEKVVGRPPHGPLERDLVIPEQELRKFAEQIWRAQDLL
ncbi:hypothetical protein N7468_007441 [Penicillium chermesinum]|uniref:Uncharacterized protein n=1 Tax=Penicillium chermesinum TaxID=63820 RepID=A0A9W9NU27_9EURO|nr:uncharacterized protein N7468_007441 [Penicillium chermesinum]KAJ5226216.1 hypothetical protein N7468_007441 [Penicillium chermesinum]KAJ6160599.1 hypothetical protein N7470_003995 [Penicillium chermesinum]